MYCYKTLDYEDRKNCFLKMVAGHLKLVICMPFATEAGLQDMGESTSQNLQDPVGGMVEGR